MPFVTPDKYTLPFTELPPVFGTTFSAGPPTSASPSPADVGDVRGHASAVECRPDTDPVQLQTSLVDAPAGAAEHDHARHDLHVRGGARGDNRIGHQRHE